MVNNAHYSFPESKLTDLNVLLSAAFGLKPKDMKFIMWNLSFYMSKLQFHTQIEYFHNWKEHNVSCKQDIFYFFHLTFSSERLHSLM